MNILQLDLADKKQVRDFLGLPFRIYRDIPQWVPPLRMDERARLDLKRYPFYRHSQAAFFLAERFPSPRERPPIGGRWARACPPARTSGRCERSRRRGEGEIVGRLAVLDNRRYNEFNSEKTAFFYLFECENDLDAARALFESAFDWARARGLNRMLGPKGFTALDGFGLLMKGFEQRPAFGLPYNPSYYPELIEALGFEKFNDVVSGYLGADIQFPERIH
ncbi:MAG: hypothetical protein Q7U34_03810, partial [Anaerolineales bacterium]|nr:hypothetical protein [Anaerolineales bacterium]